MKRTLISAAAVLAFAAAGHADELSDIQAQAKQLREQNQTMTKRLADLEKRQKALETKPVALSTANPVDSMAADLPYKAVKARPPENDDMCWHGICLYGNFDMGIGYQQHGSPFTTQAGGPLQYLVEGASNGPFFGVAANQSSTSFIGLRGKQEIADNLYAVFNLQTLFNPATGQNADQLGTIVQNNGLGQNPQLGSWGNSFGDSSKAGGMFNNVAYFGVSSPTYGTFTMGRQSALSSDLVVNYDPLSGANAWSLITFEGATGGGGVTEDRIWDNAYEYRLNVGPARFAIEGQLRNGGNSGTNNAVQGDVGFDYMGLSMDFVGGKIYDAVSVPGTLSSSQVQQLTQLQAGTIPNPFGPSFQCSKGCLQGIMSDNTNFQVGAKYTIGPWKLYGGYEHITYQNPNSALAPDAFLYGAYNLAFVNNNRYFQDKNLNVFWVGVRYAVSPTMDITGAYYGNRYGFFVAGDPVAPGRFANVPGVAPAAGAAAQVAACAVNSAAAPNCAGGQDVVSVVWDWRFARHMDMYAGIGYSQRFGGAANGAVLSNFPNGVQLSGATLVNRISSYDPGIGLRYQF